MKKVLVAMSGGVDSSVTALLLKKQGFIVEGITMHLNTSLSPDASLVIQEAKASAQRLGIKHHVADVAHLFESEIIHYFVQSYQHGETPNPCIRCNEIMKFGFLFKEADRLGCDFFSTGHYVRLVDGTIRRAKDIHKDQSYFLYSLYKIALERLVFPLGELTKPEVRACAKAENLCCADHKESQDLCFIPEGSYTEFLNSRLHKLNVPGHIVDINGKVIGEHEGIYKYTTGQRKGLGALGKRMFVKEIRPLENVLVAVEDHDLFVKQIDVCNMIRSDYSVSSEVNIAVQVRYRSAPVNCRIINETGDCWTVQFDQPVRAPSKGQSAVFYDGDCVIAGGIIR